MTPRASTSPVHTQTLIAQSRSPACSLNARMPLIGVRRGRADRQHASAVPPEVFFVTSAIFRYLGPAFAVLLFARVDVLGVAWLRITAAAAILGVWRKPWRLLAGVDVEGRRLLLAWGSVLALMNTCFYLAIDRLPLGTVAAIEFVGPIVLAAAGLRTARNLLALAIVVPGVYLLANVQLAGEPLGLAFALANAALFTLYIVLGHRVAHRGEAASGVDGLAASMLVALVVAAPIGAWSALPALVDPVALAAAVGIGAASSVIPYVCDQLAMARLSRAAYALLIALLPATATVIGIVVLAQLPSLGEVLGIAFVVGGIAIHNDPDAG